MILIIDNYDSFTYNLVQYFQQLKQKVEVVKNDLALEGVARLKPTHIVISPGPGDPEQAGESLSVIGHYHKKLPILGVCLGHQCLAQYFGAKIVHAKTIMHGKVSTLLHNQLGLFQNLPLVFEVARYHSLVIDKPTLPTCFSIDAWSLDENNTLAEIMAIRHRQYPLYGLQFHPEAILSQYGHPLLNNFLELTPC